MTNLFKKILPPATIGIIGGGQLGKMLSVAAKSLGYKTIVLDPNENCCSKGVCDELIISEYTDKNSLKILTQKTDVITFEFENIPALSVEWIEKCGGYIPQSYNALAISQDRYLEKTKLQEAGFEVAPFLKIDNIEQLKEGCEKLKLPCILKTRSGGYDGKGQLTINSIEEVDTAKLLLQQPCILEKKINFEKELSVIAVKSVNGEIDIFPIGTNVHKNGILHTTIVPSNIDEELTLKLEKSINNFFELHNILGILAIELFLVENNIVANEIAPRPHNSGHWTLDGANISQFEQHIRAICGLPLIKSRFIQSTAMVNLLGQHYNNLLKNIDKVGNFSKIHIYGKDENVKNRKIGHISLIDENIEQLGKKVKVIEEAIKE